ncbi:hypothetical protein EK904_003268 [Melospiza melodia maxima]|nr:hypothetical protein EK904_003268 [Melospiza melodia maxima]
MELLFGVVLGLMLAVASPAHDSCTCATNKWAVCAQDGPGNCTCRLAGSHHPSKKPSWDVDIADVAYYFEKDVNNDSVFPSNSKLSVSVNGDALAIEKLGIYYVDEKPPEFSMRQLAAGIGAVVTVVLLTAGIGVAVLLVLRWLRTRTYKKFECKEMREIKAPSLELP